MTAAQKIGLAAIFSLTVVIVVVETLRICIHDVSTRHACNALEPSLAVIVCALPVYGHLLRNRGRDKPSFPDRVWRRFHARPRIVQDGHFPSSHGRCQPADLEKQGPASGPTHFHAPMIPRDTFTRRSEAFSHTLIQIMDDILQRPPVLATRESSEACLVRQSTISTDPLLRDGVHYQQGSV